MESTYEIPMDLNNVEGTYELPMQMNNVEGTYDTLMKMNNVEAEVHADTKQTGYMYIKKRTVLLIVLTLIIIFVGVCVGVYFAGKTNAEVTRPSPKCPLMTCPTPARTSSTSPTPGCPIIKCPTHDGWTTHGESCYFFANDQYTNFSQHVSFCKSFNAKLIEVDSDSENQFVKDYLLKMKGSYYGYAMGLTDKTSEGKYLLYSSNQPASFLDWANNEPNDLDGNEDCVIFARKYRFKWNDISCNNYKLKTRPICEL